MSSAADAVPSVDSVPAVDSVPSGSRKCTSCGHTSISKKVPDAGTAADEVPAPTQGLDADEAPSTSVASVSEVQQDKDTIITKHRANTHTHRHINLKSKQDLVCCIN